MVIELSANPRWTPRQHPVNPAERKMSVGSTSESLFAHARVMRGKETEIESRGLIGGKEAPV